MNSRTAGRLLSGGGISQRERRVPGGPFDCGASFIVIVGNEVGTIVVSVYILLTPCHAHTRAARSLARSLASYFASVAQSLRLSRRSAAAALG